MVFTCFFDLGKWPPCGEIERTQMFFLRPGAGFPVVGGLVGILREIRYAICA